MVPKTESKFEGRVCRQREWRPKKLRIHPPGPGEAGEEIWPCIWESALVVRNLAGPMALLMSGWGEGGFMPPRPIA